MSTTVIEISKTAYDHLATFSYKLNPATSVDLGDRCLVELDDEVLSVLDDSRDALRETQPDASYSDVILILG